MTVAAIALKLRVAEVAVAGADASINCCVVMDVAAAGVRHLAAGFRGEWVGGQGGGAEDFPHVFTRGTQPHDSWNTFLEPVTYPS